MVDDSRALYYVKHTSHD